MLSEGARAIYVGARSSDGLVTYRFMADFSPGAAPSGNGVVTGKLTGVEKIPETVTFNGKTRMGYASLPLVTEAALQPAGKSGGRLEVEIVELSPPAAPDAPAAAAAQGPSITKEQQAILGKESMKETKGVFAGDDFADTGAPSDPRVTWYHYGWLVFGTANGKVLGVRVDFQKFDGRPAPAPGK